MPRYAWGIAAALLVIVAVAIGVFAGMQLSGPSQETEGTGSDQRESEREVVYKIIYIGEPVTIALPPEEKAEVAHESGARIVVPAGAVAEETTVSVAEVEPPTGALRVDRAYDFSVGDAELLEAVTVHIPFELDEGQDLSGIYALHWNEDEGAWEPVSGTVDESAGTIAVETPSLSIFSWAWIKVDATCEASPGTVDAGERITISSKGTSLTRHDINIYMRPDIKWEFEGDQYPHDTDALTQIASIGKDDQFELTYQSTLDAEGIYIIQCRLFWETVGPDVELGSQDTPSARITARGVVNWGTGHVRPPLVSSIATPAALSHSGGPVVVEFTTEDRGTSEIPAPTVEVSFVTPIFQESAQPCGVTEEGGLITRCWRAEISMPANTGPFDLRYDVTVTSEQIPHTLTGTVTVVGDPSAVVEIFDVEANSIIQATNVACSSTDLYLVLWVRVPEEERPPYYVAGRLDVGVGNSIAHLHPLVPPENREAELAVALGFTVVGIVAGVVPGGGTAVAVAGTVLTISQYLVEAQADWALEGMLLGNYVEASFGEWPRVGWEQGYLVHVQSAAPVEEHWELSMTSSWAEAAEVTVNKGAATPVFCEVGAVGPDAPGTESAETTSATTTTTTGVATPATDPVSPATIREVLTALYDATDGPNWHNQGGWFSGRPIDEWHGVSIDTTHRLIGLNLSGNRLSGEIPPELGRLTDLKGIGFFGNQLTGEIPAELGNLTNLAGLNLQGNQLTGEIPAELGNLTNLAGLNLQGNQLTGEVPAELGNLTNLQSMDLSKNQLNGQIPAAMGNLTRLKTLNLNENQLSGQIPAAMGNMTYLEWLNLSENQLGGQIPAELGSLPVLFNLVLYGNQFRECLPPKLDSLVNTDVYGFALPYCVEAAPPSTGPAADDRAALVAFADGTIRGRNWLTTAPVGRWEGVKTNDDGRVISLVVSGFQVQPEHLPRLTSLEVLRLTRLDGYIPPGLGNLTNLRELSISGTTIIPNRGRLRPSLVGEIPAELGNLANLEILKLDSWGWSGEIPAELGNLTNLRELVIRGGESQLTGGIPVELGNLTQLRRLQLESDLLGGEIPVELGNLVNLEALSLRGNNLTGCLPSAFERLSMSEFEAIGFPLCAP